MDEELIIMTVNADIIKILADSKKIWIRDNDKSSFIYKEKKMLPHSTLMANLYEMMFCKGVAIG